MTTTPVTSPSDPDQPAAQGASPRLGWWRSREWRTALRMRVGESMYWFAAITGSAAALRCLDANISLPVLKVPGDVGTVVQVVPAVVIAIFVFAAGTLFVVAQVVPQARGTRAVELLRNRYLVWTLSPALALTPLSTAALVLEGAWAKPLASALLIGAAVYLLGSTACLLAVLGEATDPTLYSALLGRRSRAAIAALATPPAAPSRRQRLRRWFRQPPGTAAGRRRPLRGDPGAAGMGA